MSYMIVDIIHKQWETRGDILVIQGFDQRTLTSPSPNFKGICEWRRCHHWFHIPFISARRWAASNHFVPCGSEASTRISKATLIMCPYHRKCWGNIATRTAYEIGSIHTRTVSIIRISFNRVVHSGSGAFRGIQLTILTVSSTHKMVFATSFGNCVLE